MAPKKTVGPINSETGKPFYTPEQWAHIQSQDDAQSRSHDEAVAAARRDAQEAATAARGRTPAAQPKPMTPAQANETPPRPLSTGQEMPAQKPVKDQLGDASMHLSQAALIANNNRAYTSATPAQRRARDLTWITPPASPTTGKSPTQLQSEATAGAAPTPTTFTPPRPQATPAPGGAKSGSKATAATGPSSPAGQAGSATGFSPDQISAAVTQMEATYGVPASIGSEMAPWYLEQTANNQTSDEMQNSMYAQPWFKSAFPGIAGALANGQSLTSTNATPLAYAQDYAAVQRMTAAYGAPGAVSPALYGELVAKGLTSADIQNNIGAVFSASASVSKQAVSELSQWYGVPNTPGAIATLLIDPNGALARANGGAGVIPSSELAGQVGAAAVGGALAGQSGFNRLSKSDLIGLASTATGAQIGSAATQTEGALSATEEGNGGMAVSQADLLKASGAAGVQGPDQATQARVQAAVGQRAGMFHGGGGAIGAGNAGVSGEGSGTQ